MAVYRQVQINYWHDSFVMELTPEEKYFYIYLLTNSETTQSGIFEIHKKIIEMDLGYNRETVNKLIKRFQDYGKILYCEATSEIMILNWMKYNFINSKNTICCINKELKSVKNKDFLNRLYKICIDNKYNVEEVFEDIDLDMEETTEHISTSNIDENINNDIQNANNDNTENYNAYSSTVSGKTLIFRRKKLTAPKRWKGSADTEVPAATDKDEATTNRGLEGACKPLGEEETKEKEEIKKESSYKQKVIDNNKKHNSQQQNPNKILLVFNKNIRQATIRDVEKIKAWLKDFEEQVVIQAVLQAVKYRAPHIGYVESVIKNWKSLGLFTMENLKKHKKKINKRRQNNSCNADAYRYLD